MMAARIDTNSPSLRPVRGQVIPASIWDLLVWAFQSEAAQLDFDTVEHKLNVGIEWVMIQQARLGCRPDGGGRSDPHPDADVVASALAVLPEAVGGRGMAVAIAEGARTNTIPDWKPTPEPRCEVAGWKNHKRGRFAERVLWTGPGRVYTTDAQQRKGYGYACPVFFRDTEVEVGRARRAYLQWWAALLELRANLATGRALSAFAVTDVMPPKQPWNIRT